MAEAVKTVFFVVAKVLVLLLWMRSTEGQTVTVFLDAYSLTSTLTDNPSTLPLGTTVILTCRTAGIPQGTDYNYTWSCPGGSSCNIGQGRNPNRKTYEDSLVLHILSFADAGTYTCSVGLDTGEMLGMDQFEILVEGGLVLHHGSNLIADNDFITDVQSITSDGMAIISCTTTGQQQPQWRGPNGEITSTNTSLPLYVIPSSNTAILIINSNNISNFTNGEFTCNTTQHTASVNLYFGPGGTLEFPRIIGGANGTHQFISVLSEDRYILSYERQDLNVPLQVEYQEVEGVLPGTGIVKPASVPGVTYQILLWAVEGNQYSGQPSSISTFLQIGQAPSAPRSLTVTRTFTGGLELNWIPPKEPNAQTIRYEIQYGLSTSDYTTVDTGRSDTYYNLTGLLQNTTYYIRVVAVNYVTASGAARTEGEWITTTVLMSSPPPSTTQHTVSPSTIPTSSITPTPTTTPSSTISPSTSNQAVAVTGGVVGVLAAAALTTTLLVLVVGCAVQRRHRHTKPQPQPAYSTAEGRLYDTVQERFYDTADKEEGEGTTYKNSSAATGEHYDYVDQDHNQPQPHSPPQPPTGGGLARNTTTSSLYQTINTSTLQEGASSLSQHYQPLQTNTDSSLQEGTSSQSQHYQPLQTSTDGDHTHTYTPLNRRSDKGVQQEETGPGGEGSPPDETTSTQSSPGESSGHYTALQTSTMDSHHYQRPGLTQH